jgi:hypothetical protein
MIKSIFYDFGLGKNKAINEEQNDGFHNPNP